WSFVAPSKCLNAASIRPVTAPRLARDRFATIASCALRCSAMLRVRVLGELQLELDGQPLVLPSRRPARVLLGWLALHPGMHARSTVAGRLWPNVRDESARVSLRTSLSALRAVIGAGALHATREHIGLAPDVWVDASAFDRLVGDGRLLDALECSRGGLLTGL